MAPTPALLPRKSHGRRSLVGCSPWGREESDTTEQLHFHFPLSCTGEGNGSPLQCSCLENPRDGVAQSRTRLKWLSSSSSSAILVDIRNSIQISPVRHLCMYEIWMTLNRLSLASLRGCLRLCVYVLILSTKWSSLSYFLLFATPWTIQSMEFSRPEYWSG